MNKVALIIIYNHQYNKNIDILERIYKGRFSNVYHLVPFYNGEKQNVIPVYESSYYFQGYVAQGFKSYYKEEFTHYFFVADDLMLNPKINENNYSEHLQLSSTSCFLPGFISLHEAGSWLRVGEAYRWNIKRIGIEANDKIPSYQDAIKKFKEYGLELKPLNFNQVNRIPNSLFEFLRPLISRDFFKHTLLILRYLGSKIRKITYHLPYPIVGSYSDIFVVSADAIKLFCDYCGVFASTELFVEVGLPTSLVLSAKEIKTEKDLNLQGRALWTKKDYKELNKYNNSLECLFENFPMSYLYIHPIKLSKWNIN
jgi:hypothetical protein